MAGDSAALANRVVALEAAADRVFCETRWYRIGGDIVAIRTEPSGNAPLVLRALAPLQVSAPTQETSFEVFVWDGAARPPVMNLLPSHSDSVPRRSVVQIAPDVTAYADLACGTLSVHNGPRRRAHVFFNDAERAPYYEYAAPLRHVLQARALATGGVMLHAAAVGAAEGGILLVGGAGSGKSSTALACLDAGMAYTSDDYVLVDGGAPPRAHMAYSTAKVVRASIDRHARYRRHFRNLDRPNEKPMLFVDEFAPERLLRSFPIHALVMPVVANRAATRIDAASAADLLRALAPSSLLLSPLAGAPAMQRMAALCRGIRCYRAELAESSVEVGDAMRRFVERCAEGAAETVS